MSSNSDKHNDHPLFNLIALKRNMREQFCVMCKQFSMEWTVIGVCHHVFCAKCLIIDQKNGNMAATQCPCCESKFNQIEDIKTHVDVRKVYEEMEDFLWQAMAAQNEMLEFYTESTSSEDEEEASNVRKVEPNKMDVEPDNMKSIEPIVSPQKDKNNSEVCSSSTGMTNIMKTIQVKKTKDLKEPVCTTMVTPETSKGKCPETSRPDSTINNSATTVNVTHKQPNMSNVDDQSTDSSSGSGSESEEDFIQGTPDRCRVSDPFSCNQKNKRIFLTYTNLDTDDDLNILRALIRLFDIHANTTWSERVTHLIVKTADDGSCLRTKKYLNALLSNCFIVTFEWAKDCLSTKTLLPEVDYMPRDKTGESSSMVSWRVGRGIIDSPMDWTSKCILYCHNSVMNNDLYTNIIYWARKGGFVLATEMEEFKSNEFKMRIILADTPRVGCSGTRIPNESEVMTWMYNYKAVTLFVDWFLECLFRYKFIEIGPAFQVVKLDPSVSDYTDMDESLFEFLVQMKND